jgi:hypothetical protein
MIMGEKLSFFMIISVYLQILNIKGQRRSKTSFANCIQIVIIKMKGQRKSK